MAHIHHYFHPTRDRCEVKKNIAVRQAVCSHNSKHMSDLCKVPHKPGRGVCVVFWGDTWLSNCLSPPTSIKGYQQCGIWQHYTKSLMGKHLIKEERNWSFKCWHLTSLLAALIPSIWTDFDVTFFLWWGERMDECVVFSKFCYFSPVNFKIFYSELSFNS